MNPQNILIIDFGQLGDVVLSLPALDAIRQKFPQAKITVAVGKSCASVIELANVADEKIVVDRVALRDGNKILSILQIAKIVREVRAQKFDFVIDLHSLAETNILGFLSGANQRLYARRENRSLDFLGTFSPPKEDKQKHATERYLDVLQPLGIENVSPAPKIEPRRPDLDFVEKLWQKHKIEGLLVGLFPGAGNESRRWKLENFAALADQLQRNQKVRVAVFLGPEERGLTGEVQTKFPEKTLIFANLTLFQFVAALSRLSLFVSNDTGPVHLASAVGTSVVVVLDKNAPLQYIPLVEHIRAVNNAAIGEITVEEVYSAAQELLASNRVGNLINR